MSGALAVRPAPDPAPPVIPADEAYAAVTVEVRQETLTLDFFPPEEDFERVPTRTSQLEAAAPVVGRLAQAIIEVVSGQRPAPQLIRHTSPTVYSVLARRALVAARRGRPGAQRRPVVRRVRVCEPADGVAEGCAVVVVHGRVRALALRLEGLDGRWVVTQLTIG